MSSEVVLIIVCISSAILAIWKPFWTLPLFLVGTFIEPIQYFPELKPYNPSMLLGGIVIASLVIHHITHSYDRREGTAQLRAVILFCLWLTFSAIYNNEHGYTIYIIYLRSYIPFFIFVTLIRTEKDLKIVVWSFIFFSLVAGLYGLYCVKMNIGIWDRGERRFLSFFSNPNQFGWISSFMIPLIVVQLFDKYSPKIKIGLCGQIALLVLSIFYSGSKKCLFGVIPAILYATTKFFTFGKKIFVVMFLIVLAGSFFYVMPAKVKYSYTNRVMRLFEAESAEELDPGRTEAARAAFAIMFSQPIFGTGLDGFDEAYINIAQRNPYIRLVFNNKNNRPYHPHNVIAEAGVYTGLVGLILYLCVIFFTYRDTKFAEKQFLQTGRYSLWGIAVFVQSFLIASMVIAMFSPFIADKAFWMVISFATVLRRLSVETVENREENYDSHE